MATLIPGLVSITFRSLEPQEIIRLVIRSGVQSIEWGGDIHVPPGDLARARDVGRWTREAGLMVAAYGSYYRLADTRPDAASFEAVLASAVALGAPTIRVWAGNRGSADYSATERRQVIDDALRIAEMAATSGIMISLEYHGGTLTDTRTSVQALLLELPNPNIDFLWQPTNGEPVDACTLRLLDVLPRLRNVHVFHWWPTPAERHPLVDGADRWQPYIEIVRESGRDVDFLLEFTMHDSPEQFVADALTLRHLLEGRIPSNFGRTQE
jgi:3-dehydroshikimate dehydratase